MKFTSNWYHSCHGANLSFLTVCWSGGIGKVYVEKSTYAVRKTVYGQDIVIFPVRRYANFFFFNIWSSLPLPPSAAAPTNADWLRKQVGLAKRARRGGWWGNTSRGSWLARHCAWSGGTVDYDDTHEAGVDELWWRRRQRHIVGRQTCPAVGVEEEKDSGGGGSSKDSFESSLKVSLCNPTG